MKKNRLLTIIVTSVTVLVFLFLPLSEQEKKDNLEAEAAAAVQAEAEAEEQAKEQQESEEFARKRLYCAPEREPEVYDPSSGTRNIEIIGAGYSDDTWAVVYGNCSVGALVIASLNGQEYSVQSVGGAFALRFDAPSEWADITFTQSYQGKTIGEPYYWSGYIVHSEPSYDPNQACFIGYENQGFYKKMLPDYQGTNLLSEEEIAALTIRYSSLVESLKSVGSGCELITVFGPSPATVYPEQVPEKYTPASGTTRLEQLQEIFTNSGAYVVDLRDTFKEHKNDSLALYYKFDSHWTDYAGYLAYVQLYEHISEKFPEAAPRQFDDFTWNHGYFHNEDIPYYFGVNSWNVYEYSFIRNFNTEIPESIQYITRFYSEDAMGYGSYTDDVIGYRVFSTGNEALPDIYVIRNSYSGQMIDIMAERSGNSLFRPIFDYTLDINDIAAASPDYVILVISEWDLDNLC